MSTQSTDHDLLMKLNTKFDSFYEEFRRVSNGVGFPRCAERLGRLDALEEDTETAHRRIDDIKSKLWWAITTSIVTGVGFISSVILWLVKGAMNT